jgi:ribose 5-phosphate isomerase B
MPEVEWLDLGPASSDRVDYPDYAAAVSRAILDGKASCGVLVCGSGIGMSIAANKFPGIRAAHAESEAAGRLAKQHNNANIICVGARLSAPEYARSIVNAWLTAQFEGGRHEDRVKKITALEGSCR